MHIEKKKRGIALICARAGSKRLKNKNIKKIRNIPLVAWSILLAKKLNMIEKVIVSTDSKKIISIAKKYGAEIPFIRPKSLSGSKSNEYSVWKHALTNIKKKYNYLPDYIISLPPTCPTRSLVDVKKALNFFLKNNFDTVISICNSSRSPYFNMVRLKKNKTISLFSKNKHYHRSQDVPLTYDLTTAFFISKSHFVLNSDAIFSGKVGGYVIKKQNGIDIDDNIDFNVSKNILEKK